MSPWMLRCVFFCLFSGMALGGLFLLFKMLRLLFGLGKWSVALLDFLYCCLCALAVFLCALAVDKGRLRFLQAGLQLAGWLGVVFAFDPFLSGAARCLYRGGKRLGSFFSRQRALARRCVLSWAKRGRARKKLRQNRKRA